MDGDGFKIEMGWMEMGLSGSRKSGGPDPLLISLFVRYVDMVMTNSELLHPR